MKSNCILKFSVLRFCASEAHSVLVSQVLHKMNGINFYTVIFLLGNVFFKVIQTPVLRGVLLCLHRQIRPSHYHRVQNRWRGLFSQSEREQLKLNPHSPSYYFRRLLVNAEASWRSLQIQQETLWDRTQFNNKTMVSTDTWTKYLSHHYPQVFWGIHLGTFEVLHQILYHPQKQVHLITEAKPTHLMSKLRLQNRQNLTIWSAQDIQGAIKATIKSNGILALLVDQSKPFQYQSNYPPHRKIFNTPTPIHLGLIERLHRMGFKSTLFSASLPDKTLSGGKKYLVKYEATSHLKINELNEVIENQILTHAIDYIWHYKWHWPSLDK